MTFRASQYHCQKYNTAKTNDVAKLIAVYIPTMTKAKALRFLRAGFMVSVEY